MDRSEFLDNPKPKHIQFLDPFTFTLNIHGRLYTKMFMHLNIYKYGGDLINDYEQYNTNRMISMDNK